MSGGLVLVGMAGYVDGEEYSLDVGSTVVVGRSRSCDISLQRCKRWLALGGKEGCQSPSKSGHRERAVWQRRFWEHLIRDERDLARHYDYIHYNPVKHGLVRCVADWPWSSFHRFVRDGIYDSLWGANEPPAIKDLHPE